MCIAFLSWGEFKKVASDFGFSTLSKLSLAECKINKWTVKLSSWYDCVDVRAFLLRIAKNICVEMISEATVQNFTIINELDSVCLSFSAQTENTATPEKFSSTRRNLVNRITEWIKGLTNLSQFIETVSWKASTIQRMNKGANTVVSVAISSSSSSLFLAFDCCCITITK